MGSAQTEALSSLKGPPDASFKVEPSGVNSPPMPIVDSLWDAASFRSAVKDLLSLSASELEQLRTLTQAGFDIPPNQNFGLSQQRFALAIAAASALYTLQRNETQDVVGELDELVARSPDEFGDTDFSSRWEALRRLIATRPEMEEKRQLRAIEHSMLPALEVFGLSLDVRVWEAAEGAELRLVPVILARLQFDEPVQSGDVVTFQLSPAELDSLQDELDNARRLLERWRAHTSEGQ
jgi:hypothetical protein